MSVPGNALNITEGGYVVFDGTSDFAGRTFQEGTGITITNASGVAGNTTISATGSGGFTWENISAGQTLEVFTGYFCFSGGNLALALPTTSSVGDTIEVVLIGASGWTITQGAGQQIRVGNTTTTGGVTGTMSSNLQGDAIRIVCQTADTIWAVTSGVGSWTVT